MAHFAPSVTLCSPATRHRALKKAALCRPVGLRTNRNLKTSEKIRGKFGGSPSKVPHNAQWLVTPIYKPFRPFGRGTTLLRGLTITMVINHVSVRPGMILTMRDGKNVCDSLIVGKKNEKKRGWRVAFLTLTKVFLEKLSPNAPPERFGQAFIHHNT